MHYVIWRHWSFFIFSLIHTNISHDFPRESFYPFFYFTSKQNPYAVKYFKRLKNIYHFLKNFLPPSPHYTHRTNFKIIFFFLILENKIGVEKRKKKFFYHRLEWRIDEMCFFFPYVNIRLFIIAGIYGIIITWKKLHVSG